jgi:hypothetical protein
MESIEIHFAILNIDTSRCFILLPDLAPLVSHLHRVRACCLVQRSQLGHVVREECLKPSDFQQNLLTKRFRIREKTMFSDDVCIELTLFELLTLLNQKRRQKPLNQDQTTRTL